MTQIFVAPSPGSQMLPLHRVRALPGRGLEGDRYFFGTGTFSPTPQKPDFELTLIEQENVEAFSTQSGVAFGAADARRNLVTCGVRLNDLVGVEIFIGTVRIRGVRLCEPCNHLAKKTFPEVLAGLVHKGGLRAQILSDGEIQVGDEVRVASGTSAPELWPQGVPSF